MHEYGTVWTLRRNARIARCTLLSWPTGKLELRILVDDHLLLTDQRACIAAAFSLADEWKPDARARLAAGHSAAGRDSRRGDELTMP